MTTKTASQNGALQAVRDLWRTDSLDGARVRALGAEYHLPDCSDFTGDALPLGDTRLLGLVLAAGRSPGFGSDPIWDPQIAVFLDGTYGKHRWKTDRPAHPWERGGGDAELDRLFADRDVALADLERLNNLMWEAKDDLRAAGAAATVSHTRVLAEAIKAWEHADERASLARSRVTSRALRLQDLYRNQQAAKK